MTNVEKKLESLKRQSCELLATTKKLCETDYIRDKKTFRFLAERYDILSEKHACCARELCIDSFAMKECEVYDAASEMLGIEIHKEGTSVVIDLPELLPGKKERETNYVGAPLIHRFEQICQTEDLKIKGRVVICIVHVYDNEFKKTRCYDYDNLESKRIIDIITQYVMVDDSPKFCDVYHTVEIGKTNKTKIIVMPKTEFENFKNPCNFE